MFCINKMFELRVHNIDIGYKNNDLEKIYPYYYSDKRINDQHMDLLMDHHDKQIHILLQVNNDILSKYNDLFDSMELKYDSKKYNLCNNTNYMIAWNEDYYEINFLKQDYFTKTGKKIPIKLRDNTIEEYKKEKINKIIYDLCLDTEYEKSIIWYNLIDKKKDKNYIIGILHFDKNDKFKEKALHKLNEFIETMKQTNIPVIIVGNFNIFNKLEILENYTHNSWIDFNKKNIKTTFCPNIFSIYDNKQKIVIDEDTKLNDEIYNIILKNSTEDFQPEIKFNKNLITPKSNFYKDILENKDIYNNNYDIINKFNNLYNKNNLLKEFEELEKKINENNYGLTNGCISYNIKFTTAKLEMSKDINSNLYHSNHYPILYTF